MLVQALRRNSHSSNESYQRSKQLNKTPICDFQVLSSTEKQRYKQGSKLAQYIFMKHDLKNVLKQPLPNYLHEGHVEDFTFTYSAL